MRTARFHPFSVALAAIPLLAVPAAPAAQSTHSEDKPSVAGITIPASIRAEHEEIMATLTQATKASGRVGAAARELAEVLQPHFEREEQIALPPLGLLAPLAAGDRIPDDAMAGAMSMSDSLRAELPRMLHEHEAIRSAVKQLGEAARAEKAAAYEQFAGKLALHARSEEEVLYPAAILVGDLVRARRGASGAQPATR